jgi:hypothetical protein
MILDERTEFADAAAIALNATNAIAPNTDVIDLGATPTLRDIGNGEPIYLVIQVDTSFTGAGNVTFDLVSDSTANLATSKTTHWTSGAIAYTVWIAGYTKVVALPTDATVERYLGLWETTSGNLTGGKINAFLTRDVAAWRAYEDATN